MRLYGASRQELFERLDQPALRPLPAEPFVYGEWLKARVNIDYHIGGLVKRPTRNRRLDGARNHHHNHHQ